MKIYTVLESIQLSDGDAWSHWRETPIVSYHKTLEGAESKIKKLIDCRVTELQKWDTADIDSKERWINNIINNITYISNKFNGIDMEEYPLYSIGSLEIED